MVTKERGRPAMTKTEKSKTLRPMSQAMARRVCYVSTEWSMYSRVYVLHAVWPARSRSFVRMILRDRVVFASYGEALEAQRKIREILTTVPCIEPPSRAKRAA